MKSFVAVVLASLVSLSAFADVNVSLTEENGIQKLSMKQVTRSRAGLVTIMHEFTYNLMSATTALDVKRLPDGTAFYGHYISGAKRCEQPICSAWIRIEQKMAHGQRIFQTHNGIYNILGDAAKELYTSFVESGLKVVHAPASSSLRGSSQVSGRSFSCTFNPTGASQYHCVLTPFSNY